MRRCKVCGAIIPEGAGECPKCGSTVFVSSDENSSSLEPLRRVVPFFSTPIPFYVKAKPPKVVDGELVSFETEWKLYRARLQQNAPSILIWDRDGYLPGKQEAALHLVEGEDLARILQELPEKKKKQLEALLRNEWGIQKDEDEELFELLSEKPLIFQPVPRLRTPAILNDLDWRGYVERLACPKPGKDSKLVMVHLAKILMPLSMHYAPHSLEITNSNTGKTRFYDTAGIKIDKATRKAVLGFAKSPTEVYPGTINGTSLPTAFDQIESQDSYALAKYMLDILETGRALVDSGGIRFVVETKSSFAYIGNPVAKDARVIEGFKALLNHICVNPAMGRRFGIILFSTNLKTIRGSEKMTLRELEEWKREFTLFRAVEEYAEPKLKQIIRHPKVSEWLHQPIKGYRETIYAATQELDDYNLAAFFEAHAEAEHRVRGAALHAACALLLKEIALSNVVDEALIQKILREAEELLSEYVTINLESIASLCRMWDKLRADQAKTYFESLSDYMKEIVSAIILHKRHNPEAVTVQLEKIPYTPQNQDAYRYFSRCINKLKQRKNLHQLNECFRRYFGFQIERQNGTFNITYFENPKPPEDLKLIGKYGTFNHLTDLTISPFSQRGISPEREEEECGSEEKGVSVKTVKRLKWLNGEKPDNITLERLAGLPEKPIFQYRKLNRTGKCEVCGETDLLVEIMDMTNKQTLYRCQSCFRKLRNMLVKAEWRELP